MGFNAHQYNTDAFEDGVWDEYQGGQFKIARMGNPAYRDAYRKLDKKYRKQYGDELTAEQMDRLSAEAVATAILVDWKDVDGRDENGKPYQIPYRVEAATDLLLAHPKFASWVAARSTDLERFERDDLEQQAKKPAKRSDTD